MRHLGDMRNIQKNKLKNDIPSGSYKTSFSFQLLQFFDAMRTDDDSCMDKVKGNVYPRSKFYHLKVTLVIYKK